MTSVNALGLRGDENLPLAGLLVADFSRVLAGPMAAVTLADLGATVVKVERTGTGDDTRHWGPPWTENSSAYFEAVNRSKMSIELDFDDEIDLQTARDLADHADVLIENFLDGTLARKGLGYDSLSESNSGIIYCSITGFGRHGGAPLPGYDFLVQAMGGLMSITGHADGEPAKVGVALVDVLASKDAVIGILAALRARDASGRGQRIEVNLLSSMLGGLANQASSFLATGQPPTRMGNQHPSVAPYETLQCRDGLVAIACGNDGQFERLAEAIGAPELSSDPRFATNGDRTQHRVALIEELEDALAGRTVHEWVTTLTACRVPAGAVQDIGAGVELAKQLGLAPVVDVGPTGIPQIRHPITYSHAPVTLYRSPPKLGEHNERVRTWLTSKIAGTS